MWWIHTLFAVAFVVLTALLVKIGIGNLETGMAFQGMSLLAVAEEASSPPRSIKQLVPPARRSWRAPCGQLPCWSWFGAWS